jgi:hypothetical protein
MTSGLEIRILYTEHFYPNAYKPNTLNEARKNMKNDPVLD